MEILYFIILVFTVLSLAYNRVPLLVAMAIMIGLTVAWTELRHLFYVPSWFRFANGIVAVTLIGFAVKPLRRLLISDRFFTWFRKALPRISDTEREAINAGTVWWEAQLFSGRPQWKTLLKTTVPQLNEAELAFLDGPVEELCHMLNDWEINDKYRELPREIWTFMRENRMLGMIIPEKYGGLEFTAQAISAVVLKISSRNLTAAITIMEPNSLGLAELILHHGTEAQRNEFLPRIARGEEIPCFAMTSPSAGSDKAGMNDVGVVCKSEYEGKNVLGLRINWNKRYITLAPVATLLGLSFKVTDPDGFLGKKRDLGITCALIPVQAEGVKIGNRHMPLGAVFQNGPTEGTDVFIPMDRIIGGQERIGQGWRMIMQSLAASRAVSLPALGTAGGKMSALMSGAYARIRRQFNAPIGTFEGIEEPLARIGGRSYRMDSARLLTLAALDEGERPSILSAIIKYQLTEESRLCINDAMDIHGGKGIATGPGNYIALAYQAIPLAITLQGANILTRSLHVFGKGAIRAHPWLLQEMQAATDPRPQARNQFDKILFGHMGYLISNLVRSLVLALTRSLATRAPVRGPTARYFRELSRMSAAFSFTSDMLLIILGGKFKTRQKLSGRMADALTHLYMGSAVLKRYQDDGCPEADLPLVTWAMDDSLHHIQESLKGVTSNFPVPGVGRFIRSIIFPLGSSYEPPPDDVGKAIAQILLSENESRNRLVSGVYISDEDDACGRVHRAFSLVLKSARAENAVQNALKQPVSLGNYTELVQKAVETGVITEEQATMVRLAQEASRSVIEVDDFTPA
jgi:acyl-CoA dehydrogenase